MEEHQRLPVASAGARHVASKTRQVPQVVESMAEERLHIPLLELLQDEQCLFVAGAGHGVLTLPPGHMSQVQETRGDLPSISQLLVDRQARFIKGACGCVISLAAGQEPQTLQAATDALPIPRFSPTLQACLEE